MAKNIKIELTEAQMNAIIAMRDEMEAMLGVGEPEEIIRIRWIRLIDRMFKNNGFIRVYIKNKTHESGQG